MPLAESAGVEQHFSADFAAAQRRFRAGVAQRHGRLDSLRLAAVGPSGEELAIDIGWFGAPQPRRVFVHSSGIHGVEGYAGSAIQLQWLADGLPALPPDAAIALVHVLNPYGFAWLRRANENNVDLNRNFGAAGEDTGDAGLDYAPLDALLNPRSAPGLAPFYARSAWLVLRHGFPRMLQAVSAGQHVNSRGLFYAGTTPEPGYAAYRDYLQEKLARAQWIVAIDVHTGLGPYGEDTLLVDAAPDRRDVSQTMHALFGNRVRLQDNAGFAYRVRGAQHDMYYSLFPRAAVHFAGQEFGTFNSVRVVAALRAENYWHHQGAGPSHPAKQALFATFCPADNAWRTRVLQRGREVIAQACALTFGDLCAWT
ncbi:MAG: DUF2817 domain-containing protein [Burkholderiales bacterium]